MNSDDSPVYLVDGSSYIFRAYFALPPLTSPAGVPTHATYGFTAMTLKFLRDLRPSYLAVVFDAGRETFRNKISENYKANRPAAPADLIPQFAQIRATLRAMNIPVLELEGFEADDLIATLAKKFAAQGRRVVIISSDKDLMQLVGEHIKLLDTAKDRWLGVEEVKQKFGVAPSAVVEVMGLMGDPVDNIPGVKGIGEKTAIALIQRFHSLESLFARLDELEQVGLRGVERIRKTLLDGKEAAYMSRELATVREDVPIATSLDQLRRRPFNREKLKELFVELGFNKLSKDLDAEESASTAGA